MMLRPWVHRWLHLVGTEPTDRTSCEVTLQDAIAELIVGSRPKWFVRSTPTEGGDRFLRLLWQEAFGAGPAGAVDWFISEHALPVPAEWREDIGLTYGCPDYACAAGKHLLIVELKTERGSYRARQMADYLRLARRNHPDTWTDVVLLGPIAPGATPPHDDRQRYAELTWASVPDVLVAAFDGDERATRVAAFIRELLPRSAAPTMHAPAAEAAPVDPSDAVLAAVEHAERMAPAVSAASPGDRVERGIDVPLDTLETARAAQEAVKQALLRDGYDERVMVWLWQPSSTGLPSTPAGAQHGRELRLAPRSRKAENPDAVHTDDAPSQGRSERGQ